VWYYEPNEYPYQNRKLARWIGVAHRVGQAMCFWLLPQSGIPIARTTINAEPQEKVYTTACPEFGVELEGKHVLIVRALYGLKSSGAAW